MDIKLYTFIKIIFLNLFKLNKFYKYILKNSKNSKSQAYQDLFAYFFSNFKKRGNFIEIGGGNGKTISNTWLLEKKYKWNGFICEPNHDLHKFILSCRNAKLIKSGIDKYCGKKIFYFSNDLYKSSFIPFEENHKKNKILKVISLNYLFKKYNLKNKVDYISIDTEGNEYEIVKNFNFKENNVKLFTVEHNFNKKNRHNIFQLFKKNGYKRIFSFISYMDDWYIKIS